MTWAVVVAVVLVAAYVTWTAGRLDRMHARVDAAWSALDAQLVRRAFAAERLAEQLPDGPERDALHAAALAAAEAGDDGREAVENDLSLALREALPLATDGAVLQELQAASTRVGLARSFHNSAVHDCRTLRRRKVPRLLRLAGRRAMPGFFDAYLDSDDTALT